MKRRSYHILLLLSSITLSYHATSQVPDMDSLQKTILKSVQQGLGKGNLSDSFFDSSKMFSGKSPVNLDQMFKELNKDLNIARSKGDINKLGHGYYNLSTLDSMRGNYKGAYENYKLYSLYRDSLQRKESENRELQAKMQYEFDKKQAIAKAEQEKKDVEAKRVRNLQYFTIAGLAVLLLVILLIALIQWRNNKQKKKTNSLLQLQKEQVESSLSELKSTQTQLIHAEKMASLGELTAGIAHEIQNPLNFVNNFSEVNNELIMEVKTSLMDSQVQKEKQKNEDLDELLNDIYQNNEKINHHGKRADTIVKGMLQHSRASSGQKELTDINALCDEYIHLAYHGLRAKDKSFNAKFVTDFDNSIGKIKIVPQDIGRVILNLINNAFYAVSEKVKQNIAGYEPTVIIKTANNTPSGGRGAFIEIKISDNGPGIPSNILDKIFQPFFTTKPTGHGTGLGLSLSYDIVTKGHGGELKVETKEGSGSTFIVIIPVI